MKTRSVTTTFLLAGLLAASASHAVPKHPPRVPLHAPALAQGQPAAAASIEVLVMEGSNGAGGIAPGLQNLPQLTRPPFSAYTRIALVARSTHALGSAPATVQLPNGNSAVITSQGRLANGRYGVTVRLTLRGRAHDIQFSASPSEPFFTVRSTGGSNALILGFIIHA